MIMANAVRISIYSYVTDTLDSRMLMIVLLE